MPSADFLARMQAAANSLANSNSRKRASPDTPREPDDRDVDLPPIPTVSETLSTSGPATRNTVVAVNNFAKKQKLRGEQQTQLDTFLNDIPTVREGKLFALLLSLQNDVGNILVAAPPFAVSPDLKTNIKSYATAVLLSPKLSQYRGEIGVQHVMQILLKHRFDLPAGIENNPADMTKLSQAIGDAFTQTRSSIKKKLFASIRISRKDDKGESIIVELPREKHQNLFGLAQTLVDGTKCRITNALCGRIALMRDIYIQDSSGSFWTSVDKALVDMRAISKGDEAAVDAMFEDLIHTDKELHGTVDIVYQPSNDVQQEVDDLIDATEANAATTPSSTPSEEPESRNENGRVANGGTDSRSESEDPSD